MALDFEYDVFLSHSSKDKPTVRELAERLKGDRLRVWLDEWVIQPGDSYLYQRKSDGAEIFQIKKQRWASYWRKQAYPVMLVIRTSDGEIRWMNVSRYLEEHSKDDKTVKQITFDGEPFTALNLQRLRDRFIPVEEKIATA